MWPAREGELVALAQAIEAALTHNLTLVEDGGKFEMVTLAQILQKGKVSSPVQTFVELKYSHFPCGWLPWKPRTAAVA